PRTPPWHRTTLRVNDSPTVRRGSPAKAPRRRILSGLALQHVAVQVADVQRRPDAEGPPAVPHVAVHGHASGAQRIGHFAEVVAADRERDVVHAPAVRGRRALGRQQVDERLAEAHLHQLDGFVDELQRAAQHVLVELPRRGLVGHAQDDVVEAGRPKAGPLTHGAAPAGAWPRAGGRWRGIRQRRPAPWSRRYHQPGPGARIATGCPARSAARSRRAGRPARCRRARRRPRGSRTPPRRRGRRRRAWRRACAARPTRRAAGNASPSGPGENTTKKLVARLCQSTLRRLATSASSGTPCTSNVNRPPTSTPSCLAMASSTEMRAGPGSGPHHRPRVTTVPGGGSADQVSAYSRVE